MSTRRRRRGRLGRIESSNFEIGLLRRLESPSATWASFRRPRVRCSPSARSDSTTGVRRSSMSASAPSRARLLSLAAASVTTGFACNYVMQARPLETDGRSRAQTYGPLAPTLSKTLESCGLKGLNDVSGITWGRFLCVCTSRAGELL